MNHHREHITSAHHRFVAEEALKSCVRQYKARETELANLELALDIANVAGVKSPLVDEAMGLIAEGKEQ